MAGTHISGPLIIVGDANDTVLNPVSVQGALFQGPGAGQTGTFASFALPTVTAIPDTTATRVAQIVVPNVACSAVMNIMVRSAVTAVGHIYDSTRVAFYTIAVSRIPGAAAVAVASAVADATIATSGTSTLTTALAVAAVVGGVTAINTFNLTIANVGTPAGISETQLYVEYMIGTGSGPAANVIVTA